MRQWVNGILGMGLIMAVVIAGISCMDQPQQSTDDAPTVKSVGAYLGQTPPGRQPKLFAPGIVSTPLTERDASWTPDGKEMYFSVSVEGVWVIARVRQLTDGSWSEPEVAPFSGRYNDIEPCAAPDGQRFFFVSWRPLSGQGEPETVSRIWVMDREGDGWGKPRDLGAPINSDLNVFYPSVTRDGTLYFTRREKDNTEFIWRARFRDGHYETPEKLPAVVNSAPTQFNACIAPDESCLIVSAWGRPDSVGSTDYYVAFRNPDDTWSKPINLGPDINTPVDEYTPAFSPDGRYFFFQRKQGELARHRPNRPLTYRELSQRFNRPENGLGDIYWVDAKVIYELRPVKQ